MINIILKLISSKFGSIAGLVMLVIILVVVRAVVFHGAGDPWWWIAIALLIIGWIGWLVWSNYQTKQKSGAIADNLMESAQSQESSARPDRRTAYKRDRENLEYTIQLLNKSHAGSGEKGSALYRLPWIMVVGPPADGKTTAIENAGIQWPQDPRMDEATGEARREMRIKGSGGTRSCNWFFSSDAIILDTAGRFQAREQGQADEEEWLQFLNMLQKQRPKRPINGVLALCSVERALGDPAEAKDWAQKMRRQINEIMENLQTHVPVYLIFNKCDLIHGFVEYFQDLNQDERKQIWGFTRPYRPQKKKSGDGLESERDAIMADFDREFSKFVDVLETRRLHRLIDPQLFSSERAALCIFPSEFRELRGPLREFISNVFYENPYGHNPMLRGIYFTSATQLEGNPIVQLMKQVAGEYDIPMEALPFKSRQSVDTYFLHDLIHDVVFKDYNLGGRFKTSLFDRTRILLAVGVVIATILLGIWMGTSYAVNKSKNSYLYSVAASVDSLSSGEIRSESTTSLDRLDGLRVGLEDYQSKGIFGVFYWAFGRNKASDLAKAANWRLGSTAEELFIVQSWEDADRILRSSTAVTANLEYYISSYKTYLFLSKAPGYELVDPSIIATHVMNNQFGSLSRGEDRAAYEDKLDALLEYYNKLDSTRVFEYDKRRIDIAKQNIARVWNWERLSEDIVARVSSGEGDYSAEDLSDAFICGHTISNAYTFSGFDQLIGNELNREFDRLRKDKLLQEILGDKLLSGNTNPLIEEYEKRAIQEWTEFFASLSIKPNDRSLRDLSASRSPLEDLLLSAADNTQFQSERLRGAFSDLHRFTDRIPSGGFLDSVSNGGGDPRDSKPPINDYLKAVGDAADAAISVGAGASSCAGSFQVAAGIIKDKSKVDYRFANSGFARALMTFVESPFTVCRRVAAGNVQSCLNSKWRKVYDYFESDFAKKYPFRETGSDLSRDLIVDFFAFGGPLKSFVTDEAKPAAQVASFGNKYKTAVDNASTIGENLGGSCSLGLIFFPGMDKDGILEEIRLFRDNQLFYTYENGPADTLQLPLPWESGKLEMVVTTSRGQGSLSQSGEWAPLKLLDMAAINSNEGSLEIRDASVKLSIKLDASSSGARLYKVFKSFRIPGTIDQ